MTVSLFDENAAILHGFEEDGSDLSAPRTVDFSYIFPDGVGAERFSAEAKALGFGTEVELFDEDDGPTPWDVTVSTQMVPNCENITQTELRLNDIAGKYAGLPDGWGFFRS